MESQQKPKINYSSLDLIVFAWDKRKLLALAGVLAIVLSILVSYQITPLFKSEVVLFAPSSASPTKYLFSNNYVSRLGLLSFGEEEQVEQMMQILASNELRDRIIDQYNLVEHYQIDTAQQYHKTKLYQKYNGSISTRRTKYLSIVVEVLDEDPVMAANIANSISQQVDTIINRIHRDRAIVALEVISDQKDEIVHKLAQLEDSLRYLHAHGMFHYENQTERLAEAYAYALKDGNMAGAQRVKKAMDDIVPYASKYITIRDRSNYYKAQLNYIEQRYYEARIEAEQILPQKYVVDWAVPSDKKDSPKKSIIVFTSTMATVIFAYILLLILDAIKKYKAQTLGKTED